MDAPDTRELLCLDLPKAQALRTARPDEGALTALLDAVLPSAAEVSS